MGTSAKKRVTLKNRINKSNKAKSRKILAKNIEILRRIKSKFLK